MILTELFFLVVYLSLVGGLFGVVSLLLSRVLKRALPLWFSLCGLALYGIPVLSPQVRLFSPSRSSACRLFTWPRWCGRWGASCSWPIG